MKAGAGPPSLMKGREFWSTVLDGLPGTWTKHSLAKNEAGACHMCEVCVGSGAELGTGWGKRGGAGGGFLIGAVVPQTGAKRVEPPLWPAEWLARV